jgi:GAF domain-containing protein
MLALGEGTLLGKMIWPCMAVQVGMVILAGVVWRLLVLLRRSTRDLLAANAELRKENEARREAEVLLKLQRDLAVALGATSSMQESFSRLLEMLQRIPGVDCGGVYLGNDGGSFDLVAHRNLSGAFVASCARIEPGSPRDMLIRGTRLSSSCDFETLSADALLEGLRSVLVVPVIYQSRVIAVLNMGSRTVQVFQPPMIAALEAAAAHIGGIVARLRDQKPA